MKANQRVRIKKVSALDNPVVASAAWEQYKIGSPDNLLSLPVEYHVKGVLINDIAVNQPVEMLREERNGVALPGFFSTSLVTEVYDGGFKTLNSIYVVIPA